MRPLIESGEQLSLADSDRLIISFFLYLGKDGVGAGLPLNR